MSFFVDKNAVKWDAAITVGAAKRIKALTGFDVMAVAEKESQSLTLLHQDPLTLVDVLYAACKPQADDKGITDVQFGESFDGEAIEKAADALVEGIINFFPPRRRGPLRKAMDKMRQMEDLAMERIDTELDAIDLQEVLDKAIVQMNSGD